MRERKTLITYDMTRTLEDPEIRTGDFIVVDWTDRKDQMLCQVVWHANGGYALICTQSGNALVSHAPWHGPPTRNGTHGPMQYPHLSDLRRALQSSTYASNPRRVNVSIQVTSR
jgi:hypothetical protein